MIRINLLPFRAVRKIENVRRQIAIFIFSIIVVTFGLYFYQGSLGNKVKTLDTKLQKTQSEIKRYENIVAEIKELKSKLETLKRKIDVIQKLDSNRMAAATLLDNMTRVIIPKRMWFTNFRESGGNMEVMGIAVDNKTIADFMTQLETAYTAVTLQNVKKLRMRDVSLKSFHIKFKVGRVKAAAKNDKAKS